MKKILTVIGARPQFIKAAPVSKALKENGGFEEILVHTGQHYDANMSQVFFDELDMLPPAYNLEVGSGGHGEQTGGQLAQIQLLSAVLLSDEKGDPGRQKGWMSRHG
jgi:UDP-GlcNAc3NAcA epimerase